MATVPGQLVWEIVKKNNSFSVKEFGRGLRACNSVKRATISTTLTLSSSLLGSPMLKVPSIIKGLLYDMSLLQESASECKARRSKESQRKKHSLLYN